MLETDAGLAAGLLKRRVQSRFFETPWSDPEERLGQIQVYSYAANAKPLSFQTNLRHYPFEHDEGFGGGKHCVRILDAKGRGYHPQDKGAPM